jgi:hypothetical protein
MASVINALTMSLFRPSLHCECVHPTLRERELICFFQYSHEGKVKEPNLAAEAGSGLLSAVSSYARGDSMGALKSAMGIFKAATGGQQKANQYAKQTRTSPADVVSASMCEPVNTIWNCFRSPSAAAKIRRLVRILSKLGRPLER